MADLGIQGFMTGQDLLRKNDMEPSWETMHGYFLASTATIALYLIFALPFTQTITCLPSKVRNNTYMLNLAESETNFVNNLCESPWYVNYSPIATVVIVLLLLCVSNVWLYRHEVVIAVNTFTRFRKYIIDTKMSVDEITEKLAREDLAEEDPPNDRRQLQKYIDEMKRYQKEDIIEIYKCKNIALIFFTGAGFIVQLGAAILIKLYSALFSCELPESVGNYVISHNLKWTSSFYCSYDTADSLFFSLVISILLSVGQLCVIGIGMRRTEKAISKSGEKKKKLIRFMAAFWTHTGASNWPNFERLIDEVLFPPAANPA